MGHVDVGVETISSDRNSSGNDQRFSPGPVVGPQAKEGRGNHLANAVWSYNPAQETRICCGINLQEHVSQWVKHWVFYTASNTLSELETPRTLYCNALSGAINLRSLSPAMHQTNKSALLPSLGMAHLQETPGVFVQHCWCPGQETELQQHGRHFPCQEQGVTSIVSAHAWICPGLQGFCKNSSSINATFDDTSRSLPRLYSSKFAFETAFYSSRGTKIPAQIKLKF